MEARLVMALVMELGLELGACHFQAQKQNHYFFRFFLCSCLNQKFHLMTREDIFDLVFLLA